MQYVDSSAKPRPMQPDTEQPTSSAPTVSARSVFDSSMASWPMLKYTSTRSARSIAAPGGRRRVPLARLAAYCAAHWCRLRHGLP